MLDLICLTVDVEWAHPEVLADLTRAFDERGNYSLGVAEQSIFPEIEMEKIKRTQGMDITIVTTAPTNAEALDLLKLMGMPFAEGK